MLKTKKQPRLRLIINNDLSDRRDGSSAPPSDRTLKVRSKLFDMTDTGIFDLPPSDLLDRSLGDATASGHLTPTPLRGLEVGQNVLVHGTHGADSSPVFGFTQPSNGSSLSIGFSRMGRPRVEALPTSKVGRIFAANVSALLPLAFPSEQNETARIAALAKATGVGKETIRHAMRGGRSPSLDAVSLIAEGLGITIPNLLTQGFGEQRAAHLRAEAQQAPIVQARRRATLPSP